MAPLISDFPSSRARDPEEPSGACSAREGTAASKSTVENATM
jgi:hypothetical protein